MSLTERLRNTQQSPSAVYLAMATIVPEAKSLPNTLVAGAPTNWVYNCLTSSKLWSSIDFYLFQEWRDPIKAIQGDLTKFKWKLLAEAIDSELVIERRTIDAQFSPCILVTDYKQSQSFVVSASVVTEVVD